MNDPTKKANAGGEKHEASGTWIFTPKGELCSAIVAGAMLLAAWGVHLTFGGEGAQAWAAAAQRGLEFAALFIGLVHGGRAALESLRKLEFDIDVLMFVGAVLAAFIGAPAEGALLLFLFTLSGALEELAMQRTTRAVEALHKLMPTSAQKWDETTGAFVEVPPESLKAQDRVRVLPGELIPVDCVVLSGSTSVNQATLTGESMPRDVRAGDEVYAGTVNVGNPIEAVVVRSAATSSLQKILDLVTTAQQQREPVQQVIDRVSQPYAVGVFVASLVTFMVFWLVLDRGANAAAYTAITLLIVASPCALIIATPTATLTGISRAARGGVLFKGGSAIARLARLRAVAFDKTGTLTVGKPSVLQIVPIGWSDKTHLMAVAAALEEHSTHPIAEAIVKASKAMGVTPAPLSDVGYVAGRGVSGMSEGKPARLGSLAHTQELIPVCLRNRVAEVLHRIQSRGHIAVVIAHDEMAGVFILSDSIRPGAECLVQRLHEQGVRPVVMLTGDNASTAQTVAKALDLDEVHAQLLPGDKVSHVQRLKTGPGTPGGGAARYVGVIGDGVNDAPALAAADVAIAVGSIGSDAALESADIVLLSDDLSTVPWAVGLARRTRRTITVNLVFALGAMGVMAVGVLIAAGMGVKVPLWMGVVGHEGGTLLVVAHSLLLLAYPGIPVCTCRDDDHHAEQVGAKGESVGMTIGGRPMFVEVDGEDSDGASGEGAGQGEGTTVTTSRT